MPKKQSSTNRIEFSLLAPDAQTVALAGDFTGWEQNLLSLKKQKNGVWKIAVPLDPGSFQYRFLVDGQWQDDPHCTEHLDNPFGGQNCVKVVR